VSYLASEYCGGFKYLIEVGGGSGHSLLLSYYPRTLPSLLSHESQLWDLIQMQSKPVIT
jgi:hypothetical protein